jgi:two-component system, LytTR family, response regulator
LRQVLADHPDFEVVAECGAAEEAAEVLKTQRPHVVFLDIQMPGLNGLHLLDQMGDDAPAIVFVTAYEGYAVKAFEVAAVDYLLKPFDRARFASAMNRVRKQLTQTPDPVADERLTRLLADCGRARVRSVWPSRTAGRSSSSPCATSTGSKPPTTTSASTVAPKPMSRARR